MHMHVHVHVLCDFPSLLQSGFLEKNNDALHVSLEQMVAVSKDAFIKQLFPEASATSTPVTSGSSPPTGHSKKLVLVSVGSKFRVSSEGEVVRMRW